MNTIARSQVTESVAVSTVRVREGRSVWFETSLVVAGRVTDGLRSTSRAAALTEHDAACAWVLYPSRRDARSARHEFWTRQTA